MKSQISINDATPFKSLKLSILSIFSIFILFVAKNFFLSSMVSLYWISKKVIFFNELHSIYEKLDVTKVAKKIITVAGTNGKGSTVSFLESILK